jgi:predicted dehydrogenase
MRIPTIMNFTRRDFAKLGALGLAARLVPTLNAQPGQKKVGYAVIGLGRIADHFMRGALPTTNSSITALVSGHRDKADRIAAQYNVPAGSIYNYENFDQIAHNPAVDAVYVALPNSMHAEYTIRAAKAGKHVLCEKPMATNVADCEKMIAACKAANVKLMIAYRCHYEPTNLRAVKLIRDGALGQVQAIESAFGFNMGPASGAPTRRWPAAARSSTSASTPSTPAATSPAKSPRQSPPTPPPTTTTAASPRWKKTSSWTMRFPSGILATCNTTYGANMPGYFHVYGSKGWLRSTRPLSMKAFTSAASSTAQTSTNQTPLATPRTSRRKPSISHIACRTIWSHKAPAKKASATCATLRKSTAPPASHCEPKYSGVLNR